MLNYRIRGLLFHYKKKIILQLASIYFLGKGIKKNHDSVCENDVKVTWPNYFVRVPSYFEALLYPTFTLIVSLTPSMDNI